MILAKIWERYFVKEILKAFFFFLLCFYGLYALIDYASNARALHTHTGLRWEDALAYYAWQFVEISEILVPFGLCLATVKTLTQANLHHELVALLASGISLKRLLRPFICVALAFTAIMYLNTQFLTPKAMLAMKTIEETRKSFSRKSAKETGIRHLVLEDGTTLLFQSFDPKEKLFYDAYWILSADEIYRIKQLYPYSDPPVGLFVDRLMRNKQGQLQQETVFPEKAFPQLKFNKKTLFETISTPEELPYDVLWNRHPPLSEIKSEKEAEVLTTLYSKLLTPLYCLLAVIAPIPFTVRFTRYLQTFFIYAISLFGLVGVFLVMDAALVLGKRQVLDPFIAVGAPFLLVLGTFIFRYARLK